MKNNISVFLEVYNEEHRLIDCLNSFKWADVLGVFVKKSTDNSLEIARMYATHVYEVDYCDASENVITNFSLHHSLEWCFYITASSRIDEELVPFIVRLTGDIDFGYDVIGLPYEMNVLGISGKFSPWGGNFKYCIIRKGVLQLSTKLHQEIGWIGNRTFVINRKHSKGFFKHFTHKDPNDFFLRHNRYVSYESEGLIKDYGTKALKISILKFIKSFYFVLIKKRTFFRGVDGFVLSLGYVSYYLMLVVYVWFIVKKKHIK